ncbi:helix-turn-helix domain-containing protein [Faecalicatena contorta]|uniref:helix-turn-helix domain-containing protein n=1 Tax=Faecalicatena contorta TaxID=39482 RepID=UPI001F191150|nr:helix-turn-helix transcriptional regulator [Faecalicatena contorta]MCF2681856.1 helix-turn-helix transcriptional regulator [Faecalicatena contorta]
MSKEITNRITALLSRLNMSQKELSVATGITESAISHYVKGDRVPRGVNLMKIAKALDTTVDYLLGNAEDDREKDLKEAKTLIARNASKMTKEEKMELVSILLSE